MTYDGCINGWEDLGVMPMLRHMRHPGNWLRVRLNDIDAYTALVTLTVLGVTWFFRVYR